MGYVIGYSVLAGLLSWFCLVADYRGEAERARSTEAEAVD